MDAQQLRLSDQGSDILKDRSWYLEISVSDSGAVAVLRRAVRVSPQRALPHPRRRRRQFTARGDQAALSSEDDANIPAAFVNARRELDSVLGRDQPETGPPLIPLKLAFSASRLSTFGSHVMFFPVNLKRNIFRRAAIGTPQKRNKFHSQRLWIHAGRNGAPFFWIATVDDGLVQSDGSRRPLSRGPDSVVHVLQRLIGNRTHIEPRLTTTCRPCSHQIGAQWDFTYARSFMSISSRVAIAIVRAPRFYCH